MDLVGERYGERVRAILPCGTQGVENENATLQLRARTS